MDWELSIEKDIIFVVKPKLLQQFNLLMNDWNEYLLPLSLKYEAAQVLQQYVFHIWLLSECKQHDCLLDPYKGIEYSIQMTTINVVNQNEQYQNFIDNSSSVDRFLFSYYFGFLILEKLLELMNLDNEVEEMLQIRNDYFEAKKQQQDYSQEEDFFKIQAFGTKIIVEHFKNIELMNSLILKAISQVKETKEIRQQ